mgnify:CR=1 FL=1
MGGASNGCCDQRSAGGQHLPKSLPVRPWQAALVFRPRQITARLTQILWRKKPNPFQQFGRLRNEPRQGRTKNGTKNGETKRTAQTKKEKRKKTKQQEFKTTRSCTTTTTTSSSSTSSTSSSTTTTLLHITHQLHVWLVTT